MIAGSVATRVDLRLESRRRAVDWRWTAAALVVVVLLRVGRAAAERRASASEQSARLVVACGSESTENRWRGQRTGAGGDLQARYRIRADLQYYYLCTSTYT